MFRYATLRNPGVRPFLQQKFSKPFAIQGAGYASVSDAAGKLPMNRLEQNSFINYEGLDRNIGRVRDILGRPLTYAEKVIYSHLDNPETAQIERGSSYLKLRPSRIALQDVSGQMALLQFMTANLDKTAIPTTVHCDHLVIAKDGSAKDLATSVSNNKEVFQFLKEACQRYNIGYWKPGSGIIHQVVLENYAFPGGLMIGTDSHTPNAGGMAMAAVGVGGADAVDAMSGLTWELKAPKIIGVHLTGSLSGWAAPKDIILEVTRQLSVKGGTGCVIEYFGPGVETLSCTGMASITNMGAETGATTSIFPYTQAMGNYLDATKRGFMKPHLQARLHNLRADDGAPYDRLLEIDLSTLEPRINGPATPDRSTKMSEFRAFCDANEWPSNLSAALIGSCTNSSYEDMSRVASLAKQASEVGLKPKIPLYISVGSEQSRKTLEKAGIIDILEKSGAIMLANACGPCSGSWDRDAASKEAPNSVITSYNRNFTGRLDGSFATNSFIASPETVAVKAFAGDLRFDPATDALKDQHGNDFYFQPPTGRSLPETYEDTDDVYTPPPPPSSPTSHAAAKEVTINPGSDRLQRLTPFPAWDGEDYHDLPILIKVKGKCTTDHISPGGPWFRYRGHLENISNGTLIGAVNAESGAVNSTTNVFTGERATIPATARDYKARGQRWVVVAEHNYGEGSSREHAALQPRFLNGVAVIAKSLPRIHEGNLKKQGMLALTFVDERDYERIRASDRISLLGLDGLRPGGRVRMVVRGEQGSWETELEHTLNEEQVLYFKYGSALNLMGARARSVGGQLDA